jgi:hypothetical protein
MYLIKTRGSNPADYIHYSQMMAGSECNLALSYGIGELNPCIIGLTANLLL